MTDKPWLLIDIDGVLNPLGEPLERPGFTAHEITDERGKTFLLRLNPEHGDWLLGLTDVFDLAWCTTWWEVVDERIASLVGLPTGLPAVPLPRPTREWKHRVDYKAPHVRRFAAGRSVAWIDDDLSWLENDYRLLRDSWHGLTEGVPPVEDALLFQANPFVGLVPWHIEEARAWAEGGASRSSTGHDDTDVLPDIVDGL